MLCFDWDASSNPNCAEIGSVFFAVLLACIPEVEIEGVVEVNEWEIISFRFLQAASKTDVG